MLFAAPLLSALAGPAASSAAVGAGAAASTGILGTGITGSFLASVLQGGVGLVGAMAAMREGQMQATAYRGQAQDAKFDARSEEIAGAQRQDSLRRDLVKTLGERDVAYAASGVDLSFGTPQIARGEAVDAAGRAVAQDQETTAMRAARLRERAAYFKQMALGAEEAGLYKAVGAGLTAGMGIAARG